MVTNQPSARELAAIIVDHLSPALWYSPGVVARLTGLTEGQVRRGIAWAYDDGRLATMLTSNIRVYRVK